MTAIEIADSLKQEADELLFGSGGVDQILSKYGPTSYTGSYVLNLLAWRDIDLYLDLDNDPHQMATLSKILAEFAQREDMLRVLIDQNAHLRIPSLPVGFYFGAKLGVWPHNWKIDVWVIDRQHRERNKEIMQQIQDALTPEKRALILQMKHKLITSDLRTPSLSGYHLYQAVLFKGLTAEDEIRDYLKLQGIKI